MGNLALAGSTSGTITLAPTAVAGSNTITLPAATGTVALTASPTFTGTVTATTVTSPSATALTIQSASTTAMTIDTSQNVGIGTASPVQKLDVVGSNPNIRLYNNTANGAGLLLLDQTSNSQIATNAGNLIFSTNSSSSERMRIDTSGNVLMGITTSSVTNGGIYNSINAVSYVAIGHSSGTASGNWYQNYQYAGNTIGTIAQNGTTGVTYNTTSDYRLKENVAPMTTGLATISALRPVTYDWISDKSAGEGFIAHEIQAVIPHAVTGEKDAVNEDGSINPQGVDYSRVVVHLVAALQELSAKNDALTARIVALEAK